MVLIMLKSNIKLIISLGIVFCAILFRNELFKCYEDIINNRSNKEIKGIFTEQNLILHDGVIKKTIYLAVLGAVFDVTKGKKHYQKGAGYHYFVGKDGSRALVTGNFKDETSNKDHVIDLSCNELFTLLHWRETFKKKYVDVGVLVGRYYDKSGEPTAYSRELNYKLKGCEIEKEQSQKEELKYPSCNMAWSADEGTKVWCTKSSGGVTRNWVGVPRQLFTPGIKNPRCVCINKDEEDLPHSLLKEYDNCPNTSSTCLVN